MSDAEHGECVRCGMPILHEPMLVPDVCESCWWEQELIVSQAVREFVDDTTGGPIMHDERHPHHVRQSFHDGSLHKAPHNLLAHLCEMDAMAARALAETDWQAVGPRAEGLRYLLCWLRGQLADTERWALDVIRLPECDGCGGRGRVG